jgi:hypothetical protein
MPRLVIRNIQGKQFRDFLAIRAWLAAGLKVTSFSIISNSFHASP